MVSKVLVLAALLGSGVAGAYASDSKDMKYSRAQQTAAPRERVILVQVTGSLIPQRVVISGNSVNSASPVSFYGRNDLLRTGSSDVAGALAAIDPSVWVRRP